jgi:alkylation response protein AidB-like acyl-CoA dehydrogenase
MAWDFSTDPELQRKLDWAEDFCREEIEPLDLVFPYAVRSKDPKIRALVKGLQDQIKAQGLWAIFLDGDLGGPGYGQLELALLNEVLGRYRAAPAMLRLMVLHTAWKIDNSSTRDARTEIAAVKFTMAKVLREISFRALHIHGALGTTGLTPLQAMYAGAPSMGIADGVDEVHRSTVARRVLDTYRPQDGYWPTEYIPAKRAAAWEQFRPRFDADPELLDLAEAYEHDAGSWTTPAARPGYREP